MYRQWLRKHNLSGLFRCNQLAAPDGFEHEHFALGDSELHRLRHSKRETLGVIVCRQCFLTTLRTNMLAAEEAYNNCWLLINTLERVPTLPFGEIESYCSWVLFREFTNIHSNHRVASLYHSVREMHAMFQKKEVIGPRSNYFRVVLKH